MSSTTVGNSFQLSDLIKNSFTFSRLVKYKSNYSFCIETDGYIIKTAEKLWDLYRVFSLRQSAFLMDDQESKIPFLIDVDSHDFSCDHVVIYEKKSGKICGTYRMQSSLSTDRFYSQDEFHLDNFLKTPYIKLELGRACIHPDFRNGAVIDLLWRGIAKYAELTNSRYLFGCSSARITDPQDIGKLMGYLKSEQKVSDEYKIQPTENFQVDYEEIETTSSEVKKLLPSLLRTYLQGGAHVYGRPALDKAFDCIDLLTILDLKAISPAFKKRYFNYL